MLADNFEADIAPLNFDIYFTSLDKATEAGLKCLAKSMQLEDQQAMPENITPYIKQGGNATAKKKWLFYINTYLWRNIMATGGQAFWENLGSMRLINFTIMNNQGETMHKRKAIYHNSHSFWNIHYCINQVVHGLHQSTHDMFIDNQRIFNVSHNQPMNALLEIDENQSIGTYMQNNNMPDNYVLQITVKPFVDSQIKDICICLLPFRNFDPKPSSKMLRVGVIV